MFTEGRWPTMLIKQESSASVLSAQQSSDNPLCCLAGGLASVTQEGDWVLSLTSSRKARLASLFELFKWTLRWVGFFTSRNVLYTFSPLTGRHLLQSEAQSQSTKSQMELCCFFPTFPIINPLHTYKMRTQACLCTCPNQHELERRKKRFYSPKIVSLWMRWIDFIFFFLSHVH